MPGDDPVLNLGGSAVAVAAAQAGMSAQQAKTRTGTGVDDGLPGFWVPDGAPFIATLILTLAPNRTYGIRFIAPRSALITKLGFALNAAATVDDSCEVAILSGDLTKILGTTQNGNGRLNLTPRNVSLNLQTPFKVLGGQVCYAVFASGAVGGTAAKVVGTSIDSTANIGAMFGAAAGLLEQGFINSGPPISVPLSLGGGISQAPLIALLE